MITSIIPKPELLIKKVKERDPSIKVPKMVIIENSSIDQKDIKQYMRETNKTIMSTYRRTKEHEPITQPVSRGQTFFNARRGS